jgi:hypothetical protein
VIAQHQDVLVAEALQHALLLLRKQRDPLELVVPDAAEQLRPIEIVVL